jgi:ATP-dependent Clp protease protease subunit
MLSKILIALLFLAVPIKPDANSNAIDLIELKKDNFVSLRETINQDASSRLLSKLNAIENKHTTIYIYINSPGGNVNAGLEIINYIKSLQNRGKQINCIAHNAMSMAFVIFQYCSERYILYSSSLMQHQMTLGLKGKLYDINSRMSYLNALETKINQDQATRLKLSLENFTKLIQNDWWLYSEDILANNAADKMVSLFCSFDNYEETSIIHTAFGEITLKYSACPTINYPLQISFPTLDFTEDKKTDFMNTHINFNA